VSKMSLSSCLKKQRRQALSLKGGQMPILLGKVFFHSVAVMGVLGIKFHFPDLNPFHWMRDWLKDWYKDVGGTFEHMLFHPPRLPDGAWKFALIGNSVALTHWLWFGGFIAMIGIMGIWQPLLAKFPYMLMVGLFIILGAPYFYGVTVWAMDRGDELAKAAVYTPKGTSKDFALLPDINNILALIVTLFFLIFFTLIVAGFLYSYVLMNLIVQFSVPVIFALSAWHHTFKRALSWLFQMALVSLLFGRVFFVGAISLTQLVADNIPNMSNSGGRVALLIVGLLMGIIFNIALLVMAHKGYQQVTGKVRAVVTGSVTTMQKINQNISIRNPYHGQERLYRPPAAAFAGSAGGGRATYSPASVRSSAEIVRTRMPVTPSARRSSTFGQDRTS